MKPTLALLTRPVRDIPAETCSLYKRTITEIVLLMDGVYNSSDDLLANGFSDNIGRSVMAEDLAARNVVSPFDKIDYAQLVEKIEQNIRVVTL